jgi:hypothetical protein
MGEGLILPNKADARTIALHLNAMFCVDAFPQTRDAYRALKIINPDFLTFDVNATGNSKRKRSLRFAAWVLTSDIKFNHPGPKGYPAKRFKLWLRWLTWIERHQTTASVNQVDQNGTISTLNEKAPQAIINTMVEAFESTAANVNIAFDWDKAGAGDPALGVWVRRIAPDYQIHVVSKREQDLPAGIKDNEDDEFAAPPNMKTKAKPKTKAKAKPRLRRRK